MSAAELSSIRCEKDGEKSAQDTWTLVKKLTKVEEQYRASNLLHLSSKYSHSKRPNRSLISPLPFTGGLVVEGNVGEVVRSVSRCCRQRLDDILFRLESPLEGGRRLEHSLT